MRTLRWIVGIILVMLFVYVGFFIYFHMGKTHPYRSAQSSHLSKLIDLDIASQYDSQKMRYKPRRAPGRKQCTDLYEPEEYEIADLDVCDFTVYSNKASNHCPIFSLGRTCISVIVPEVLFSQTDIHERISNIISNPCDIINNKEASRIYDEASRAFGCYEFSRSPKYAVYVVIVRDIRASGEFVADREENFVDVKYYPNGRTLLGLVVKGFWKNL